MTGYEPGVVMVLIGMLVVYLLPTLIAVVRRRHIGRVLFTNIVTGWTILGWLWSLGMAIW